MQYFMYASILHFLWQFEDLRSSPNMFKENFHMTVEQFDIVHDLVKPLLIPKRNTWRSLHITSKHKLALTLE